MSRTLPEFMTPSNGAQKPAQNSSQHSKSIQMVSKYHKKLTVASYTHGVFCPKDLVKKIKTS
jgi:hypothetical protein